MYEGSDLHTPGTNNNQSQWTTTGSEPNSKHSSPLSPQGLYSGIQRPPSILTSDSRGDNDDGDDNDDDNDDGDDNDIRQGTPEELREIVGYGDDDDFHRGDGILEVKTHPFAGKRKHGIISYICIDVHTYYYAYNSYIYMLPLLLF